MQPNENEAGVAHGTDTFAANVAGLSVLALVVITIVCKLLG